VQDLIFFALTVGTAALRVTTISDAHADTMVDQRIDGTAAYTHSLAFAHAHVYAMWPRTLYGMMVIMLYVRVLQYLRYNRELGVLTIVIGHMLRDVMNFLVVLTCFSAGFAFAFAVMMPEHMIKDAPLPEFLGASPVWYSMWGIFGMVPINKQVHEDAGTMQPGLWALPLFMWLYLFITIVILVNLLIAQMSDTYANVTSEGLLRWQFERAQLIDEFKDAKKPLPPPFNVFWFALITLPNKLRIQYRRLVLNEEEIGTAGFKLIPRLRELSAYRANEKDALKRCLQTRERRAEESSEARVERLQVRMDKLDEVGRANFEALNGRIDEIKELLVAARQ